MLFLLLFPSLVMGAGGTFEKQKVTIKTNPKDRIVVTFPQDNNSFCAAEQYKIHRTEGKVFIEMSEITCTRNER